VLPRAGETLRMVATVQEEPSQILWKFTARAMLFWLSTGRQELGSVGDYRVGVETAVALLFHLPQMCTAPGMLSWHLTVKANPHSVGV